MLPSPFRASMLLLVHLSSHTLSPHFPPHSRWARQKTELQGFPATLFFRPEPSEVRSPCRMAFATTSASLLAARPSARHMQAARGLGCPLIVKRVARPASAVRAAKPVAASLSTGDITKARARSSPCEAACARRGCAEETYSIYCSQMAAVSMASTFAFADSAAAAQELAQVADGRLIALLGLGGPVIAWVLFNIGAISNSASHSLYFFNEHRFMSRGLCFYFFPPVKRPWSGGKICVEIVCCASWAGAAPDRQHG